MHGTAVRKKTLSYTWPPGGRLVETRLNSGQRTSQG